MALGPAGPRREGDAPECRASPLNCAHAGGCKAVSRGNPNWGTPGSLPSPELPQPRPDGVSISCSTHCLGDGCYCMLGDFVGGGGESWGLRFPGPTTSRTTFLIHHRRHTPREGTRSWCAANGRGSTPSTPISLRAQGHPTSVHGVHNGGRRRGHGDCTTDRRQEAQTECQLPHKQSENAGAAGTS